MTAKDAIQTITDHIHLCPRCQQNFSYAKGGISYYDMCSRAKQLVVECYHAFVAGREYEALRVGLKEAEGVLI